MGGCQSDSKGKRPNGGKQQNPATPQSPAPAAKPTPALPPAAAQPYQPTTPVRETPRGVKQTPRGQTRREELRPAPLQRGRSKRRLKSSEPVLGYYSGRWYVAEVTRTAGECVDVVWDDDSFTRDLPRNQTYALEVGAPIEAQWGGEWYPCKILQLHPSFNVQWKDLSECQDMATTALRPPTSPILDSSVQVDPQTPTKTGVFGRRPVLMPGSEVEVKGTDGHWHHGVVHKVGDACTVEYANGVRAAVCEQKRIKT